MSIRNWIAEQRKLFKDKGLKYYSLPLNPITWSYVLLPVLGVLAAFILTVLIVVLFSLVVAYSPLETNPIGWWQSFLLTGLLSTLFVLPEDDDTLTIPETRFAAQLLWLGMAIPAHLVTGHYPKLGKRLGFSRSKRVLLPFTDDNGFVKVGDLQFRVWNDADAPEDSSRRTFITAPAKNDAIINGALTLEVQIVCPRRLLDFDNPAVSLGDRARQEWRETVGRFVDTDVPKLQSALAEVFMGKTLITSFLGSPLEGHKTGSMVINKLGRPMYLLSEAKTEDELERAEKEFARQVVNEGNLKMRSRVWKTVTITNPDTGKAEKTDEKAVLIETVQIEHPIGEVLKAIGCDFKRLSVADLDFSKEVQQAAAQASAEQNERIAQLASAKTIKASRKELLPDKAEVDRPGYELAMLIAAAQDDKKGNVKIVHVSGGDSLAKAAVAGGLQVKGGDS